jgi:membrane-associated phospholipid phosphatase
MTVPRDKHKADRVGSVKFARLVSDVLSPPTMFAAIGLALAIHERPNISGVLWGVFFGLAVSLLPILFVVFMLKTGRIGDLHMSATQERHLPYIVAISAAALALVLVVAGGGPAQLTCLALFNIVVLILLGLINTRWLISIHATAAASTWLIAAFVFGWRVGFILLPLAVLVAWARLFLRRHTPAQVFAGLALGLFTVVVFRQLGCFFS